VKKIVFGVFMLSVFCNNIFGMDILPPSLRFVYVKTIEDRGFEQIVIESKRYIELMDQEILNKLNNKYPHYMTCTCTIPGFPKKIRLYNPSQFLYPYDEKYASYWLNRELAALSQERRDFLMERLSIKK
jgi:hypothetical protein